jgi:hypothetical protein
LSPAKEPVPPPASADAGNEIAAEVAFWNTVENSGDRRLLESYLTQYPNGRFASLAKIFIARIDSEAAKPPKAAGEPPGVVVAAPIATPRVEPSPGGAGKAAAAAPPDQPTKVAEAGAGNDTGDRTVGANAIPTGHSRKDRDGGRRAGGRTSRLRRSWCRAAIGPSPAAQRRTDRAGQARPPADPG